jgi:hypothetical protein
VKNIEQNPSFFGNSGFFVPHEVYKNYVSAAESVKTLAGVSDFSISNDGKDTSTFRMVTAMGRQETHPRIELLQN